jgi:hypothetical protein
MYICARTQRYSNIKMKSQAASSTVFVSYSKILLLKYTTIDRFEKYTYNDEKKLKRFYRLVYVKYLMLRGLRNTCNP